MSDQVEQANRANNVVYLDRPAQRYVADEPTEVVVLKVLRNADGKLSVDYPDELGSVDTIGLLYEAIGALRAEAEAEGNAILNGLRQAMGEPPRTIAEAKRPTRKRPKRKPLNNVVPFPS